VEDQSRPTVCDVERLGTCSHRHIEIIEEVVTIHPRRPIAELDQADPAGGRKARVHMDVRFAAAVVRIIEEDKVALALILVGACAVPKPFPLSKERIMKQRDKTQRNDVDDKEKRQRVPKLQTASSLLNADA
jgi:hypothetical protein